MLIFRSRPVRSLKQDYMYINWTTTKILVIRLAIVATNSYSKSAFWKVWDKHGWPHSKELVICQISSLFIHVLQRGVLMLQIYTVNVLKVQTLYSILFCLKFALMQLFLKILSWKANSVDPDQTAPDLGLLCSHVFLFATLVHGILGHLHVLIMKDLLKKKIKITKQYGRIWL